MSSHTITKGAPLSQFYFRVYFLVRWLGSGSANNANPKLVYDPKQNNHNSDINNPLFCRFVLSYGLEFLHIEEINTEIFGLLVYSHVLNWTKTKAYR